jgi:hypothetical protein
VVSAQEQFLRKTLLFGEEPNENFRINILYKR